MLDSVGTHLKAGSERECVYILVGLVRANFCHCCVFACICSLVWIVSIMFMINAFRLSFVS